MEKDYFSKEWKKILIDIGKSETEVAKELNKNQSNLNRKIRTGTIKPVELANILEHYGYTLKIIKMEK